MKLPKLKIKINKNIIDTALGIVLGVSALGALGFAAFTLIQSNAGIFSYAGLAPQQIDKVAATLRQRCKMLSSVKQGSKYRGIYLGGECGFPLYYHYEPGVNFSIYPLLWNELWTTNKDMLNLTGTPVYP